MPTIHIRFTDSPGYRFVMRGNWEPSAQALLAAGERQRARIYDRTLAGRDYLGRPFAPYSTKGPVYWYPRSNATHKARRYAATRYSKLMPEAKLTRSGVGLRFANYAALKAALGRSGGVVDLFGPGPGPHMLNAMEVRSERSTIVIGIYDERAARLAEAHNKGGGHLPQRRWFDVGPDELRLVAADVRDAMFL